MIDNLREVNDIVNAFANYIVKTACENTTTGNYRIDAEEACAAVGMDYDDYLEYRVLIVSELIAREELLDVDLADGTFDVICALDYCPNYEWSEGDERIFGSYEEFEARTIKPIPQPLSMTRMSEIGLAAVAYLWNSESPETYRDTFVGQLGFTEQDAASFGLREILGFNEPQEAKEAENPEPDFYYTVRDADGNDVGDKYYSGPQWTDGFENALNAYKAMGAPTKAMLGLVKHYEDGSTAEMTLLERRGHYDEHVRVSNLADPELELAVMYAQLAVYPFDEVNRRRIDALEKRLGIYDRDVDLSHDLYVGKWRVHVIPSGGHFGVDNREVNHSRTSMVEFWDMSCQGEAFPDGQFTGGRYYISNLFSNSLGVGPEDLISYGLRLDLDVPDWTVSGYEMKQVYDWLKTRDYLPGEYYTEYHGEVDIPTVLSTDGAAYLKERLENGVLSAKVGEIEELGVYNGGVGYSFAFTTSATPKTATAELERALHGLQYEFYHEDKVVPTEPASLDEKIKSCEQVSKAGAEPSGKGPVDRDDR